MFPAAYASLASFFTDGAASRFRVYVDTRCLQHLGPIESNWSRPEALETALRRAQNNPSSACLGYPEWCEKFSSQAVIPAALVNSRMWSISTLAGASAALPVVWGGLARTMMHIEFSTCLSKLGQPPSLLERGRGAVFLITPDDHGPCFPGNKWGYELPNLELHPVLTYHAVPSPPLGKQVCYVEGKDIPIPVSAWHVPPLRDSAAAELSEALASPPPATRDLIAFMVRGSDIAARAALVKALHALPGYVVVNTMPRAEVIAHMRRARFCLMADGHTPWSSRLTVYAALGCVPVIVSNGFLPYFHMLLDWSKFSLRVAPANLSQLPAALAAADYPTLYANLMLARELLRIDIDGAGDTGALPVIVFEMFRSLRAQGLA